MRMIALAALLAILPQSIPQSKSVINGLVLHQGTGEPIGDAQISLTKGGSTVASTVSDSKGHFEIPNLDPGTYVLTGHAEGFMVGRLFGGLIPITPGQARKDVAITFVRAGSIAGHITDSNGKPLEGMEVSILRISYGNGKRGLTSYSGAISRTNDMGEYRESPLPPGIYYICADPRDPGPYSRSKVVYGQTCFPGKGISAAEEIQMTEGQEIQRDFTMQSGGVFSVEGRAVFPAGVSESRLSFFLTPVSPDHTSFPSTLRSNGLRSASPGLFQITGVLPGSYELFTIVRNSSSGPYFVGRTPIQVRDSDLTDLVVQISANTEIQGQILSIAGGKDFPMTGIRIRVNPRDSFPGLPQSVNSPESPVDAMGKFSFSNLPPGSYSIQATGLPAEAYISGLHQDGQDISDNGVLTLRPSPGKTSPTKIELNFDVGKQAVQGVVDGLNPVTAPGGATVVLIPNPPFRENFGLYKTQTADFSGHFSFRGIPPGRYKVFAFDNILPGEHLYSGFLHKYEERGFPLNVEMDGLSNLELHLIATSE